MKNIVYVPETVTLTYMLEFFRQKQQHMAIIIDEYGGTLGLITIEDLLEEIVGEIRDEYDIEEENFKSISENVYELLGETLVDEINEKYELDIEESEEYDTISGYIQYKLERVANENDKVINDGYIIQVLKVDNKKIEKVKLIIKR
nr:transporter associated domain-containing protein [Streptobacillus felis]